MPNPWKYPGLTLLTVSCDLGQVPSAVVLKQPSPSVGETFPRESQSIPTQGQGELSCFETEVARQAF